MREIGLPLDLTKIKTDLRFKWHKIAPLPFLIRPIASNLGPVLEGAVPPRPDISDPLNGVTGVAKRIAYSPPRPNFFKLRKIKRFTLKWCKRNLTPLAPDTDYSFDWWINTTNYTLARKEELRELWEAIKDSDPLTIIRNRKHVSLKCFVKDEWYVDYKFPRGIFSRSDTFKTLVGPVFKRIEEQVFSLPYFIKKIPVKDRPKEMKNRFSSYSWFAAADFSSFEAHFTRPVMEAIEFVMYKFMVQFLPCAAWFIIMLYEVLAGDNHCHFKYFSFIIEATRASGEMCTSLGNSFANLMIILFVCWILNHYLPFPFVEGDDSTTGYRAKADIPTVDDYRDLGFTIKMEVSNHFNEMSFCGNIFDIEDEVVVTDPVYVMCTYGWGSKEYCRASTRTKKSLLRAKSLSLKFQYAGCPIITSLADYGLRMTAGTTVKKSVIDSYDVYHKDTLLAALKIDPKTKINIPPRTRLLMEKIFGITVATQLAIEKCLDQKNDLLPISLPVVLDLVPDCYKKMWGYVVPKDGVPLRDPPAHNAYYAETMANFTEQEIPWWFNTSAV